MWYKRIDFTFFLFFISGIFYKIKTLYKHPLASRVSPDRNFPVRLRSQGRLTVCGFVTNELLWFYKSVPHHSYKKNAQGISCYQQKRLRAKNYVYIRKNVWRNPHKTRSSLKGRRLFCKLSVLQRQAQTCACRRMFDLIPTFAVRCSYTLRSLRSFFDLKFIITFFLC